MNITELKKRARFYRPVLRTDKIFSYVLRRLAYKTFTALLVIFVAAYIIFSFGAYNTAYGIVLILFSLWATWSAWEMFYNSLKARDPHKTQVTPLVAQVALVSSKLDITKSFLKTPIGKECLKRFGVEKGDIKKYLTSSRIKVSSGDIIFNDTNFVNLPTFVKALFDYDTSFKDFTFKHAIQEDQFIDLCEWIERRFYLELKKSRWWTRDALMRVQSVGVAFSYGRSYVLERFSQKVESTESTVLSDYFEDELDDVEDILVRAKEANALIVGSRENQHMIHLLQKNIERGAVHPQIEHKSLFVLDTEDLISSTKDKATFEQTFIKILKEIEHAGNIILVLNDLPRFILSAQSMGVGVLPLLEPHLASSKMQVIAFAETSGYHQVLEPNETVRERFEQLLIPEKEKEIIRVIVENYISSIEKMQKIFFEYGAVDTIVNGVERYFVKSSPIDEVTDILVDLSGGVASLDKKIITGNDVLGLFEDKTGIPLQKAGEEEKQKLIHLEEFLHKRVVGQENAISSIADALRRVRSGISNPDRPVGTFLFLGPTGVGKTETTKALAESFFGSEHNIRRLDMSEFSSSDSITRLIGSFETGKVGVLPSMIRENPYGILLLDEFEKASSEVHDLFLQVLDEGIFSDMRGDKVNARNTIIIATSNAGSDLIWKYSKQNENVAEHQSEIVEAIISQGIFKPELVNRFDGVVVFHPLLKEHVVKIADLMVKKLSKRLRDKGVDISLSQDAMEFIVTEGVSSSFGARELNRVLQDKVESAVARMMLEGKINQGDTATLTRSDIE